MTKVWSGNLDCTFHGKMHWELNEELWFLSHHIVEHRGDWEKLGVKLIKPKDSGWGDKIRIYAPKGYHTDLASIPRAGWVLVAPWDVARAAIIHDVLYGALRTAFLNGSMDIKKIDKLREVADHVFLEGMSQSEPPVKMWKAKPCFWSVRPFGRFAIRKKGKDFKI